MIVMNVQSLASKSVHRVLWLALLISAAMMVFVIPLCYVPAQVEVLQNSGDHGGWIFSLIDGPWMKFLTVDRSGGTIVCIALFFGVCIRYTEYQRRLDRLRESLWNLKKGSSDDVHRSDEALRVLLHNLESSGEGEAVLRVEEFRSRLHVETRLGQFEDYLVAIGLIGTLLAFYLGFRDKLEGLDFASLDETARELLTVVGTAAISSVVGIGLGMILVRALADRIDVAIERALQVARGYVRDTILRGP